MQGREESLHEAARLEGFGAGTLPGVAAELDLVRGTVGPLVLDALGPGGEDGAAEVGDYLWGEAEETQAVVHVHGEGGEAGLEWWGWWGFGSGGFVCWGWGRDFGVVAFYSEPGLAGVEFGWRGWFVREVLVRSEITSRLKIVRRSFSVCLAISSSRAVVLDHSS